MPAASPRFPTRMLSVRAVRDVVHARKPALILCLAAGALAGACHTGPATRGTGTPADAAPVAITYTATVRPDAQAVTVEGLVDGARAEDVLGWARPPHDYGVSSPTPDSVWATPAGVRFLAVVRLRDTAAAAGGKPRTTNAPDPALDTVRLRSWGYSLFPTPVLRRAPARLAVNVEAPAGWAVVTSAGGGQGGHFEVGSLAALRGTALFAGAVRDTTFQAAGAPVVLAARRDDPIPDRAYARVVGRLLAAQRAYFGVLTSARVAVMLDRLDGAATYAPGVNVSVPAQSATVLIRADAVRRADTVAVVGPLAHELAHTWLPYAFGDDSVTGGELGAFFAEGFTNYAGYRTAHAAGLLDDAAFARALSNYYLEYRYVSGPGRAQYAAALPYSHGMLAAWGLDLALLRATHGRRGLADVLQRLVRARSEAGLTRRALVAALTDVGGAEVGALYGTLADTARPLALAPLLEGTGIRVDSAPDVRQAFKAARAGTAAPVVRFAPAGAPERAFLARFLWGAQGETQSVDGR